MTWPIKCGTLITTNKTISVSASGGEFSTIQDAINSLASIHISPSALVTIQVADGTYNITSGITANHPDGARIRIIGNASTPANCILSTVGSGFDCLTISNGNTLGYLNGFTFYKTVKALAADNATAILALNGATIICGPSVVVDNWYYGIAARIGSSIVCDYASVNHSGDVGIWAFVGSSIQCDNAVSNNAIDVANSLGYGILAEYGSVVDCSSASATGCNIAGIAALSNSQVRALTATASTNVGSGFLARDGGTIEAHGATASSNTRYGVESIADGHVYYTSITTASNVIADLSPKAYFDNRQAVGARLVADGGDLRLDVSGSNNMFFNSAGGLQFGVRNTASVSSYLTATGSSAAAPSLNANGSATDIDVKLIPKGAGVVAFGAFTGGGDTVSNGYITIKDSGGTVRKIMVTA